MPRYSIERPRSRARLIVRRMKKSSVHHATYRAACGRRRLVDRRIKKPSAPSIASDLERVFSPATRQLQLPLFDESVLFVVPAVSDVVAPAVPTKPPETGDPPLASAPPAPTRPPVALPPMLLAAPPVIEAMPPVTFAAPPVATLPPFAATVLEPPVFGALVVPPAALDPPVETAPPAANVPPAAPAPPVVKPPVLPPLGLEPPVFELPPVALVPPAVAVPPVAETPPFEDTPPVDDAPPVPLAPPPEPVNCQLLKLNVLPPNTKNRSFTPDAPLTVHVVLAQVCMPPVAETLQVPTSVPV